MKNPLKKRETEPPWESKMANQYFLNRTIQFRDPVFVMFRVSIDLVSAISVSIYLHNLVDLVYITTSCQLL